MATTKTNGVKVLATREFPAVRQARILLPCGHEVWVRTPSANARTHCDRRFYYLVDGDELTVRESSAK